ncbi:MAG: hypothetical protein IJX11_05305 [Bacteroidales bacterium]|nr:hypothetical protein [Bacteroidales bacterium]
MKKNLRHLFLAVAASLAFSSCEEQPRNTEELIDPWLRERTPVNLRLESQIGAAVITDNWRNDAEGSIVVSLITGGLDLSAVKVVALDFEYPDSEFCPVASIAPGSTLDLSDGKADFTVTAYNGETRTYTVSYSQFKDPLEGTYSFTQIGGLLDSSAPMSAFIIHGGWDDAEVRSTVMDKWWHWGDGYMPTDEDDNLLSFRLEEADAETGATFGTLVNTPGPDGKYANYMFQNSNDVNGKYRIFPTGKSRWAKPGDGSIVVYAYEDEEYAEPLWTVNLYEAGDHSFSAVTVTVPDLAFGRSHEGPFDNIDWNWPDSRWFTDNVRNTFWLVHKDTDAPLANHSDLLAQ